MNAVHVKYMHKSDPEAFNIFLSPTWKMPGYCLKLNHNFLPTQHSTIILQFQAL
jgi:hypothetical protein